MSARATNWLRQHTLRVTPCRQDVLELFFQRKEGLTHADVEAGLSEYDRVTLYRTLATLLEKDILHRVPDAAGLQRFALGASLAHNPHIHFQCLSCGTTRCLEDTPIPELHLPTGYTPMNYEYLVQGMCAICVA
jgi:Fur family transcriptional regulator, ferric uptake regulator